MTIGTRRRDAQTKGVESDSVNGRREATRASCIHGFPSMRSTRRTQSMHAACVQGIWSLRNHKPRAERTRFPVQGHLGLKGTSLCLRNRMVGQASAAARSLMATSEAPSQVRLRLRCADCEGPAATNAIRGLVHISITCAGPKSISSPSADTASGSISGSPAPSPRSLHRSCGYMASEVSFAQAGHVQRNVLAVRD